MTKRVRITKAAKRNHGPNMFEVPAGASLQTIVVDASQLYEFLALGVVTPPRYRSWRRWRTFLGDDGEWRGVDPGDGVVQAVRETGRPVVLSFDSPPSDASGVFPVSLLKSVAVCSQEEMDDLGPRLLKDDYFHAGVGITVNTGLSVQRISEASAPDVDSDLSRRLRRADQVLGGLAGLLALYDGSEDVLEVLAPFVADRDGAVPQRSASDALVFENGLGALLGLSGEQMAGLLGAVQAHYRNGALDRLASLTAICETLAGRRNLDGWRGVIQGIIAGNSEAKASMVADPEGAGEDLLLRVLALILVRLPHQMTVDELIDAASNVEFPIGRRVACVAAGIVGACQGLEAQRTVKRGRLCEFLCGLLADGIAAKPGVWSRASLRESESRYEKRIVLAESDNELVSARTVVPLSWERPIAQIRDWASRHGDKTPDETVRFRFDRGCVEVSTEKADHTIEVHDLLGGLKEISISASVQLAKKKTLQLKHWKALNELQAESRCCISVNHDAGTCVFKVSQLRETWDQHEVDWAFDVIAEAIGALWRSDVLSPELEEKSSG